MYYTLTDDKGYSDQKFVELVIGDIIYLNL